MILGHDDSTINIVMAIIIIITAKWADRGYIANSNLKLKKYQPVI